VLVPNQSIGVKDLGRRLDWWCFQLIAPQHHRASRALENDPKLTSTMRSAILNVTFDCHDPRAVSTFWCAVTGYSLEEVKTPGNDYWVASAPNDKWPRLVFVSVPEKKVVKNRVHLDLMPVARDQEAELNRLLGLGATIVDDRRLLSPGGWLVLVDPEGNEFCLE